MAHNDKIQNPRKATKLSESELKKVSGGLGGLRPGLVPRGTKTVG